MYTLKNLMLVTLVWAATSANAGILILKEGTQQINGITISTAAQATLGDKTYDLTTVGSGLRVKWIVPHLIKVPVYVLEMIVSEPNNFVKTDSEILSSIDKETSVALRLSFVHDVGAADVSNAFAEGLDANGIKTDKGTDARAFLDMVTAGGAADNGGVLTLFLTREADGGVTVAYENIDKTGAPHEFSIKGGAELMHDVLSIWLGTVSQDQGLADLKTSLLGKN